MTCEAQEKPLQWYETPVLVEVGPGYSSQQGRSSKWMSASQRLLRN